MYGQHRKIPYAGVAAPNRAGIAKSALRQEILSFKRRGAAQAVPCRFLTGCTGEGCCEKDGLHNLLYPTAGGPFVTMQSDCYRNKTKRSHDTPVGSHGLFLQRCILLFLNHYFSISQAEYAHMLRICPAVLLPGKNRIRTTPNWQQMNRLHNTNSSFAVRMPFLEFCNTEQPPLQRR